MDRGKMTKWSYKVSAIYLMINIFGKKVKATLEFVLK